MAKPPDLGPDAPVVDSARLEGFYKLLATLQVDLDPDPLELGPKRINEKIATCRGMLSRCERSYLEVSQDLHWYKRRHRLATATHSLKVQELLTNDPEVRAGRNVTDREAVANIKLRGDKEVVDHLRNGLEDLESVLSVIRTKRDDLRDIQGRLRDQLKVCQEEIGLGARWGYRSPPWSRGSNPPPATKAVDTELNTLLDDALVSVSDNESLQGLGENTDDSEEEVLPPPIPIPGPTSGETDTTLDLLLEEIEVSTTPQTMMKTVVLSEDLSTLFS